MIPAATLVLDDALVLDARRAAWLPGPRLLAVADTHLGHAWVQRARGQLVPVGTPDDSLDRLAALVRDHAARRLVIVGDVVHAALDVPGLRDHLAALATLAPEGAVSLEKEIFPKLIAARQLVAHITRERFYDIGTPDRLKLIEELLAI